MTDKQPEALRKPTGKLAFAYQTIAALEQVRADLEAENARLREALQLFDVYVTAMENDDHVAGMLAYGQFEDAARTALKETS